ncbi:hypothetical protein TIFTF001_027692 [Ficus carica]|uniref:Uncharacterized protein n=1 Tax=Ficus carica TaxID=3494 RepID=A0AA88DGX9_FICCA|nr:hypothetical protein TIFTF001_026018 [Ficus carica]GMN58592.1 hypothetical protein TIFTF001_027692 [Ficus carica]
MKLKCVKFGAMGCSVAFLSCQGFIVTIVLQLMKVGSALGLKAIQQMLHSYKEGKRGAVELASHAVHRCSVVQYTSSLFFTSS